MIGRPARTTTTLRLDGTRQRWWILVIVLATYMCTHHYSWTIGIAFGYDFVVNFWRSDVFAAARPWDDQPTASIALDFFVRAAVVVVGATLNAFLAYVFDLTFFEGNVYLYLGIVAVLHIWYVIVEQHVYGEGVYEVPLDRAAADRPAAAARRDRNLADDAVAPLRSYADYALFFGGVVVATLLYRDLVIFAEPYTYLYYFGYIGSVFFLVLVRHVSGCEWQPLTAFFAFWLAVAIIGASIFLPNSRRKHTPSEYFSREITSWKGLGDPLY